MLNNDIIANFLGLCNVTFDKICKKDDFIKISLSAAPESQICPCCKNKTSRIHDYRLRKVKLPEIAEKLILGKFIFENHTPTFDKEPKIRRQTMVRIILVWHRRARKQRKNPAIRDNKV